MTQVAGRVQIFDIVGREFIPPELLPFPQSPANEVYIEFDAAVL